MKETTTFNNNEFNIGLKTIPWENILSQVNLSVSSRSMMNMDRWTCMNMGMNLNMYRWTCITSQNFKERAITYEETLDH